MKNNLDRFSISFFCSIAIHLLVIYFFLFELPSLFKKLPEEQVIVFEMLPVSDKSNVPNKTKQLEKAIENEDAKKVEQNRSAPKQEEPKSIEEKKPEPKVEQPKPIEEKKPEPKINQKLIEQKKSPEKKKADKADLDSLLKNLEQSSEGTNSKSNKQTRFKENNEIKESRGPYDDSKSLSISESALIKQQIERQWNVPIGAENIEQVKINLYIAINTDGSIKEVKLDSATCHNISNNICSALSNSAIRAVWQASPIKNLLPDRYEIWKEFILTFDPSRML